MSIHIFEISKHTTARRYLARRDINHLKKSIISTYGFYRNYCCLENSRSEERVQKGQSYVLVLTDSTGNEHVSGVVKVDDVNDPKRAEDLTDRDLDRIVDRILARGNRAPIDDLIRNECSLRIKCALASAFSDDRFEIELFKPAPEKILPPEKQIKPDGHKEPDDVDLASGEFDFVLSFDEEDRTSNLEILNELEKSPGTVTGCFLDSNHSIPPKHIERMKMVDEKLAFKLVPLSEYITKPFQELQKSCTDGALDVVDPDDETHKNEFELILGDLHSGIKIGSFEVNDLVEQSSNLDRVPIEAIEKKIETAGRLDKARLEEIIAEVLKDEISTRMTCRVTFNDSLGELSGKTQDVTFSVLAANSGPKMLINSSTNLRRVRNIELSPGSNVELVSELEKLGRELKFTVIRKG